MWILRFIDSFQRRFECEFSICQLSFKPLEFQITCFCVLLRNQLIFPPLKKSVNNQIFVLEIVSTKCYTDQNLVLSASVISRPPLVDDLRRDTHGIIPKKPEFLVISGFCRKVAWYSGNVIPQRSAWFKGCWIPPKNLSPQQATKKLSILPIHCDWRPEICRPRVYW